MIIGIGTDLVEIERIEQSMEKLGERFAKRILTAYELEQWRKLSHIGKANAFIAKRFAAKEAAVKALGTGIGQGVSFQHFTIKNKTSGQPYLEVEASIEARFDVETVWHLSITDERKYAQAFVILEAKG
ncbi:holo-ACP synthase [Marinomonas epiphytica]